MSAEPVKVQRVVKTQRVPTNVPRRAFKDMACQHGIGVVAHDTYPVLQQFSEDQCLKLVERAHEYMEHAGRKRMSLRDTKAAIEDFELDVHG